MVPASIQRALSVRSNDSYVSDEENFEDKAIFVEYVDSGDFRKFLSSK